MKVLNLCCAFDHHFEGWFASEDAFAEQTKSGRLACPLCGDLQVRRLPSAPRLNLGGKPSSAPAERAEQPTSENSPASVAVDISVMNATVASAALQTLWLQAVQHVMANTQDVGERFPEEARRIHYGEEPHRPIRGQASRDEVAALRDEGIELMSLPMPAALKGPVQ